MGPATSVSVSVRSVMLCTDGQFGRALTIVSFVAEGQAKRHAVGSPVVLSAMRAAHRLTISRSVRDTLDTRTRSRSRRARKISASTSSLRRIILCKKGKVFSFRTNVAF